QQGLPIFSSQAAHRICPRSRCVEDHPRANGDFPSVQAIDGPHTDESAASALEGGRLEMIGGLQPALAGRANDVETKAGVTHLGVEDLGGAAEASCAKIGEFTANGGERKRAGAADVITAGEQVVEEESDAPLPRAQPCPVV